MALLYDTRGLKAAVPLSTLLERDGLELRNAAGGEKTCRCPFHEDDKPSLYVNDEKGTYFCHGCGAAGDHIAYIQQTRSISFREAAAALAELAGSGDWRIESLHQAIPAKPGIPHPFRVIDAVPDLSNGIDDDRLALAKLRGLALSPIEGAVHLGLLRFGTYFGRRCWIVRDQADRVAQARRLDGVSWSNAKALRLPCDTRNKAGSWPLGVESAVAKPSVEIVEGEGDLLAAIALSMREARFMRTGFACMLGAGNRIHPAALPFFVRKEVVIRAQNDEAGRKAAERWKEQLATVGAEVEIWRPPGPGQDLGDYARTLGGAEPARRPVRSLKPASRPLPAKSISVQTAASAVRPVPGMVARMVAGRGEGR